MEEPKGKISVVMPTGKRLESINNLSEAIKANAEAAVALAKVIENLNPGQITITGCIINTQGSTGIHVGTSDDGMESGVFHYSPTGYTEHDYGYPDSMKLNMGDDIPKCYGEEDEDDESYDETYEDGINSSDIEEDNGEGDEE